MLELEVGIWGFEGCVCFLGFPRPANPLAPKTENPPRRQSDQWRVEGAVRSYLGQTPGEVFGWGEGT